MPPKRKRNSKKDSDSKVGNQNKNQTNEASADASAAASSANTAAPDHPTKNTLFQLLNALNDLSQSRSRCSAAIQVIPSAPFRPSTIGITEGDAYTDAHLLVLGTYVMNVLLSTPKKNAVPRAVEKSKVFVLTFLSSRISLILLQDKNQLERVCNVSLSALPTTNEAMVVLGKTLISTVCASIASFQMLVSFQSKDGEKDSNLMAWAMWTNINTLERLLNASKKKVTPSIELDPNSTTQPAVHTLPLSAQRHAVWSSICEGMDLDETNALLQQNSTSKSKKKPVGSISSHVFDPLELLECCNLLESSSCITKENVAFLATYLDSKSDTTAPPPGKRKRKVVEAKQTGPVKELSDIIGGNSFGAKMILTKFVSMALMNCCKGQHLLLEATEQMMNNSEYWANIMHTESISLEGQDLKLDKKKGKKKKTVQVKPSRHLCLNVFASRVINLIHDAGKHLNRDRVAEIDQYVSSVCKWDQFQETVHSRNICNISIALMKSMLNIHKKCLMEVALAAANDLDAFEGNVSNAKDRNIIYLLVNQEEQKAQYSTNELAMLHPMMSNSFEMLIKAISLQAGVNEAKEVKLMTAIISSLGIKECVVKVEEDSLQNQSKSLNIHKVVVCDAKLASFVISEAKGTVKSLFDYTQNIVKGYDSEGCSELSPAMIQTFLLDQPLLLDDSKEYAGIFSNLAANDIHENFVIKDGYCLGLFLRTFLPTRGKISQSDVSKSPEELIKSFLDITLCCLQFNNTETCSDEKITAKATNIFTRSILASDCLDTIRCCITFVMLCSEAVNNIARDEMRLAIQLRAVFRHIIRPFNLIPSVIEMGVNIEDRFMKSKSSHHTKCNTIKDDSMLPSISHLRFSEWEKRLWNSHIRCCLAFGRGNDKPIFYSGGSSLKRRSWIGSPTEKMGLFEEILSDQTYETMLHFPTSIHAILASSTASDPFPKSSKDAAPESFLCNKVLEVVISSLNDPDNTFLSESIDFALERPPLPKRDAQLVAISIGRIPRKDQQKILSRFIREFESAIIKIKDTDRLRNLIYSNKRYASLLAKTITLCSHMIDIVCIGKSLTDLFTNYVRETYYDLDYIAKEISGKDNEFSDWHKDQSYVGLWRESFKPDLPPINDVQSLNEPLSPRDISSYTSILDVCLDLGFDSARSDKCYLLFSAWNAGTKATPFTSKEWFSQFSTTGLSKKGHGKQLRAIWELMCNLYESLETSEYTPDSLLSSLNKRRRKTNLDSNERESGVDLLKSTVKKSAKLLNIINIETLNDMENDSFQLSSGDNVVLEATVGFMSFLAAMFTSHQKDYLGLMGKYYKRRRKTSSFSGESLGEDELESDEGSNDSDEDGFHDYDEDMDDEDLTIEGVRKLEDICVNLGASPLHPDWLDDTCHLRPNITDIECVQLAQCMLDSLTSFGAKINEKFDAQLKDALVAHRTDSAVDEHINNSAIETVRSICFSDARSHPESSQLWKKELSSIFHLDESFVEAMCNDFPCRNAKFVKETFAVHASTRIRGGLYGVFCNGGDWLPSQAGYRSTGEWELLFLDSFITACADLNISSMQNSNAMKFAKLLQTKRLLQSTLSAIVSVNALLRFGISGSMGPRQISSTFVSENNVSKTIQPHHTVEISHHLNEKSYPQEEKKLTMNSVNNALCFLAKIQAHGYHGRLKQSARAALCHLVSRDTDVLSLETPYALQITLHAMHTLIQSDDNAINLIDKIVESSHFCRGTESGLDKLLLLTLGFRVNIRICSAADAFADLWILLRSNDVIAKYEAPAENIDLFCDILVGQSHVTSGTRLRLLNVLQDALAAEAMSSTSNGLSENILKALEARGNDALNLLVQNSICDCSDHHDLSLEISESLCIIMMLLVRPLKDFMQTSKLDFFRSTLTCLRKNMRSWMGLSSLKHVLCLTLFLSIRLGIIKEICDALLSHIGENYDIENLSSLELLYRVIADYHKVLVEGNSEDKILYSASPPCEMNEVQNVSRKSMPTCCTYTSTAGDFTDQHWYNCFTCGLVYDKGCCSLCAQICHKDHDVGYSRKSSFFCDCGAEVRTNIGKLRCRCLSPLSQASLSALLSKSIDTSTSVVHTQKPENYWHVAITLSKVYFPDIAKNAVTSFLQTIEPTLIEQLFHHFDQCFDSCLNRKSFQESTKQLLNANEGAIPSYRDTLNMALRSFKEPHLSSFDNNRGMNLLRSSKRHIVSVSFTADSSIDRSKKLLLAKDSVIRNAILADSRGRILIAESKGLLFCSSSSLINTRHVQDPNENLFDRRQLSVIGQKSLDFSIVGMASCPDRNRQVVLWGFSSAAVYIVNKAFDGIQFTIQLITNIEKYECDSEYIVKAEWLTDNIVVLFCTTCIYLYEIERYCTENDKKFSCFPSLSYVFGSDDSIIKSGVIISANQIDESHSSKTSSCIYPKKRIVTLLDDGRMNAIDVKFDMNGSLALKGELIVDGDAILSFPLPNKMHQQSVIFEAGDPNASTLGDGSLLHFLPQSYLLLYKCSTSDLIAFTLNDDCEITGSFEFLPRVISFDVIGDPAMESVYGPYSNFCELGISETNEIPSYRLAFTAKSVRANSPQLMYMEFNRLHSKVKRLSPKSNLNHIMGSSLSFEGITAFSAPKIISDSTVKGSMHTRASFVDRSYIISLMSNGCISLFTDDPVICEDKDRAAQSVTHDSLSSLLKNQGDRVAFADSVTKKVKIPTFPLNYFETLKNITKEECVVLGGEGFSEDKATLKRKLCTGGQEYVVCSSRDGCTLTLSLQRNNTHVPQTTSSFDPSAHAIVAVRFLLGTSQTDYFPKEVSVLGRQLKVHRQKKRWYDVPLTDEEIMLVVRSGVISISLLGTTDSEKNDPTIDAIEVYADERANLRHLFPVHIVPAQCSQIHSNRETGTTDERSTRTRLNACVLTLSHILQMIDKSNKSLSAITESSLQRLIEATTIASNASDTFRENVADLVLYIKKDTKASDHLLDKGILRGICTVLHNLQEITETSEFLDLVKTQNLMADQMCDSILTKLNFCLSKATQIVKKRPGNYKNVLETSISSGIIQSSIALSVKAILTRFPNSKQIVQSMELLVELIIHEASWSHVSSSKRSEFACLKDLTTILTCSEDSVVKNCCERVLKVVEDLADHLVLSHQCDGCGMCPISNTRYTMDEDGYDIDLCQNCYEVGSEYANLKSYDANLPVLIDTERVYVNELGKHLSCAEIKKMTSKVVPIHQSQIKSFESEESHSSDSEVDDEELQTALRMSMEGQGESGIMYKPMQMQISNTLLDIVIHNFSDDRSIMNTTPVMNLLLKLALHCKDDEMKRDLCKNICESLCKEIANVCQVYVAQNVDKMKLLHSKFALLSYTRTLISLLKGKDDVERAFAPSKERTNESSSSENITAPASSKGKTDPRFVCNVHGIPAVRRRCSHGENKDKRFYVCGMERKQRCNYFKWADDVSSQAKRGSKAPSGSTAPQSKPINLMDAKIQSILWKELNKGSPAAHNQLCSLLIHFIQSSPDGLSTPEDSKLEQASAMVRNHLYSTRETSDDENDGITSSIQILSSDHSEKSFGLRKSDSPLLLYSEQNVSEICLHFLSSVASFVFASFSEWNVWYAPLSHIILKSSSASLKSEAKTLLKCICRGDKDRYHQIRDSFVFASEFTNVLLCCETPFCAARDVMKKGRLCGPHWQDATNLSWDHVNIGSLIGTHDLIPEDAFVTENMEKLKTAVNNLVVVAKSRGNNWRHFCSLKVLPESDTTGANSFFDLISSLSERSPITFLFWLVCILPSDVLGEVMFLFSAALQGNEAANSAFNFLKMDDNKSMNILPSFTVNSGNKNSLKSVPIVSEAVESPTTLLLNVENGLSLSDIFSFVTIFVAKGDTLEIRSHAAEAAQSLVKAYLSRHPPSKSELDAFLKKLMTSCLQDVGLLGVAATEFLKFINTLFSMNSIWDDVDKTFFFRASVCCYVGQIAYDNSNPRSSRNIILTKSQVKKASVDKLDLSRCRHCKIISISCKGNTKCSKEITSKKRKSSDASEADVTTIAPSKWTHTQLSEFHRIRLDMHHAVSTEFSSFVQLRSRYSISDVFLNIRDQRGRFVKSINIYFSPKPVGDVNTLAETRYEPFWQFIGSIELSKGASTASCKLKTPVVAANLKFEYIEFYEKVTGQKTASGAPVLHCPRCTRIVNNAHGGVCGHCGEVAFQCRKCRHINYDQLDAFLCVECGYCSSGTFTWELNAGVASCAVAIENENDLERSILMLQANNKNVTEIRENLEVIKNQIEKKYPSASVAKKKIKCDHSAPLSLAISNKLPRFMGSNPSKKTKSRVKEHSFDPSGNSRTQSLINLARSLRGDGGSDIRSTLGDFIIQHTRMRENFPFEDDDVIVDDTNGLPFSVSDPLTRLVARLEGRARDASAATSRSNIDLSSQRKKNAKDNKSDIIQNLQDEAKQLYTQLCILERGSYDLESRITAWKRLNRDDIAPRAYISPSIEYNPSSCSNCAPSITFHLLEIVHSLLESDTSCDPCVLDTRFIRCLFDEQEVEKPNLILLKRSVLVTIAKNSDKGSLLILDELRRRLAGARDTISAEILGTLLESQVKNEDKFADLAVQILST